MMTVFAELFGRRAMKQWKRLSPPPAPGAARQKRAAKEKPAQHYERIFSLAVTLWYLVFQRLNSDKTLAAVVHDIRHGGADRLSPSSRKPLSKKVRSTKTSSYNEARQRMPLDFLRWALQRLGEYVQGGLEPLQRTFQLIDGSTLPMLSKGSLGRSYPPARNQNGASHWCLMRVVVGFCALTGVALGATEASTLVSEQVLAWQLMQMSAAGTVWIGDSNFGVWSVAAKACLHRQDVIFRLTPTRAKRLAGKKSWVSGQEQIVQWHRGKHDQAARGTEDTVVVGRLIFVRLYKNGKHINLWLFTTLMDTQKFPIDSLVQWYGRRWHAELNFRYVKTALQMEELNVATAEMARKELFAGLIAYNLVRIVMVAASAHLATVLLSFSDVCRVLRGWLVDWGKDWRSRRGGLKHRWDLLIAEASRYLLPKRKRPRSSEPRRVRHRRQKFPGFSGSRAALRLKYG